MLMRYLGNRGIAARLWLGFGVVLLLLLAIAGLGLQRLQSSGRDGAALLTRTTAVLDATSAVQVLAAQRALLMHDLVLNDNLKVQRETAASLKSNTSQQATALQRLAATAGASGMDESDGLLRALDAQVAKLQSEEKAVLDKVADARIDEAKSLLTDSLTPQQQSLQKALREFSVAAMGAANTAVARGEAAAQRVLLLTGALALLASAIGGGVAWATTRGIVRPLHAAREAALQVAQGDLTQEIHARGNDEIAQLVGALEWMRMSLADAVKDIRAAALGVRSGAQQIERGNVGLAARTEDQAASLEETASSIEELTATVQQNASGAGEANVLARGASGVATRGGEAVRSVVATMQGIHQSSSRIGDIIGVIDGIAFQTNILALNAAVEAARAGEQGRGFAVVAAEVRSLAQRSAAAAKEIKVLIDESAHRVDTGVREVEGAGKTMDEIVTSVRKVDALIAEIAHASAEQLAGIEQVNRAIAQMEGNTQQNNTVVEQAAAAAEQLSQQAEALVQTVARFKVEAAEAAELEPASRQLYTAAGGQPLLGAEALPVMGAARLGAGA